MKTVSVSQLKASLSEYLAKVKAGEEVLVMERRKPIAMLVPFDRPHEFPEYLLEMARQGRIRLPRKRLTDDFWNLPMPEDPEGSVLKALLEEREEGW